MEMKVILFSLFCCSTFLIVTPKLPVLKERYKRNHEHIFLMRLVFLTLFALLHFHYQQYFHSDEWLTVQLLVSLKLLNNYST